ncbi:MAG TPA: hypothetical protein VII93_14700 [Anaerolineales bacterium]
MEEIKEFDELIQQRKRRLARQAISLLKYRTMYERQESYPGAKVTARDDSRVTPVAPFMPNRDRISINGLLYPHAGTFLLLFA